MTMADQHTTGSPYADAWQDYWKAGWRGIVPLPYMRKMWPPDGYSGRNGIDPSYADCMAWADTPGPRNLALRVPVDVIGLDVDDYGDKGGDRPRQTRRRARSAAGHLAVHFPR